MSIEILELEGFHSSIELLGAVALVGNTETREQMWLLPSRSFISRREDSQHTCEQVGKTTLTINMCCEKSKQAY